MGAPLHPELVDVLKREAIEEAIDALVDLLNQIDGDPDAEDIDVDLEVDDPLEEDDHAGDDLDQGEADLADGACFPVYGRNQARGPLFDVDGRRVQWPSSWMPA